ncbi:MAG: hypothetical protein K2G84_06895, partial [Muribaculaceae bacterium]|nr:hypothetical protein [Muribaculaceae bacterium]
FKGHDYVIQKVAVVRPGQSGIEEAVSPEPEAATFDFGQPYEIYSLDGRQVSEMVAGRLYILRQGEVVRKWLAR